MFEVLVLGRDLDFSDIRGLLRVNDHVTSAEPEVRSAPIGASVHDPDAPLSREAPSGGYYTLQRKMLTFRFAQPCDLDAHYSLELTGMKVSGTTMQLAPVPYTFRKEWRPVPFD